jgi:S1-C subfamily serine protease
VTEKKDIETSAKPPQQPVVVATSKRRAPIVLIVVAAVILCAAAGFGGMKLYYAISNKNNSEVTPRQTATDDGNQQITQEEEVIANVVEQVSPSVVSIVTSSQTTSFYGEAQEEEGAGSGVIVSSDGYILTNKHVVDGTNTVNVVLHDGTTYENVKVLGSDPLNDIAFLKIDGATDLAAAELGDSSSIRVGQKVVTIGNSLGQYQNTVTSGIVSGTGRPISAQAGDQVEHLTDLIQTDAAINPGNSGGPLLNLSGQVIGINTAIVEDAQGIGFAIPINATKGMLKGVLEGKGVQRAYLGVTYISITATVAKEYSLPVKRGAFVYNGNETAVVSGSPAAQAGVQDRDIITKVGDLEVGAKGEVGSLVAEYAPGDTIELTILRNGQTLTVKVTLAAYQS